MKRFVFLLLAVFLFSPAFVFAAKCGDAFNGYNPDATVNDALNDCTPDGAMTTKTSVPLGGGSAKGLINVSSDPADYTLEGGVKNKIKNLTYQLMIVGGVLAVAGIVISAILMTTALGDEKKVGEAKNGLKYSVIGFLCIIIAYPLVNSVINLIFDIVWSNK